MQAEQSVTVEDFVKMHPCQAIEIMSPCGIVNICPETNLAELWAHAGVSDTHMPISWDEIKGQVIMPDNFNFHEDTGKWYALSQNPPEQDRGLTEEETAPAMTMEMR